jgi:hypothetical protein
MTHEKVVDFVKYKQIKFSIDIYRITSVMKIKTLSLNEINGKIDK